MKELFIRYKNRIPDPGDCKVLAINFEKRKLEVSNGAVRLYPSFNEVVGVSSECDTLLAREVDSGDEAGVKNFGVDEVDIINHPELGDTFIDYQKDPPAKQWMRIAVMLREQGLIVVKDGEG